MHTQVDIDWKGRVICWFSCGATSAVATSFALRRYANRDVRVCYCDTASEHPDNVRFRHDCEEWFGQEIIVLKSQKYADIWDVFNQTRWLVGPKGARCTGELKKVVRFAYQEPDDLHVFGFDAGEPKRVKRFKEANHDIRTEFPLMENGFTKKHCLRELERAGIELPAMYLLGYPNNNCIGCVKGQQWYWNKIRVDFPLVFKRMSQVERELDVAICKSYAGDGKRKRVFLDELDPAAGRYDPQKDFSCGVGCGTLDLA